MSSSGTDMVRPKKSAKTGAARARRSWPFSALILLVFAALVLWQLNAVVAGLSTMAGWLQQAEPIRRALGGAVSHLYGSLKVWITPLLEHWLHTTPPSTGGAA